MRQIKDILDLAKLLKGSGGRLDVSISQGKAKSIRTMASQSILQFPLLVSSNVSVDVMKDLSRALEGEYSTLVKIAMENDDNQILNINNKSDVAKGKTDYIKRFHTNVATASLSEAVNIMENDSQVIVKLLGESKNVTVNGANISLLTPISEDVNKAILNDMYNVEKVTLMEAKGRDYSDTKRKSMKKQMKDFESYKSQAEKAKAAADKATDNFRQAKKDERASLEKERLMNKNRRVTLDDNKLMQNNQLPPITMEVTINYILKGDKEARLHTTTLTVGIKAVTHVIPASEFAYFLPTAIKENNLVFRAIQFTTGEIRLVRDFLLNINRVKRQSSTAGNNKKVSKWWHTLTRFSQLNKIMSYFNKNKFLPSTTMILNLDDVQNIKTNEGVDILTKESAKKLFKIYFLLGLIIVDDNNNLLYMYDEESETFKTVPMANIQSQSKASSSGDLKTLMNIMAMR